MTADQFIRAQLAAFAWKEAGHIGGWEPMLAVAYVIRNRALAGWNGGDLMKVMDAHDQVAATIPDYLAPDVRDLNFRTMLQKIDDVVTGMTPDTMTQGALYYAELHRIERAWFRENVSLVHPRIANVGTLVLFA